MGNSNSIENIKIELLHKYLDKLMFEEEYELIGSYDENKVSMYILKKLDEHKMFFFSPKKRFITDNKAVIKEYVLKYKLIQPEN